MTQVKICGVNSVAAFDAVLDAEADYLGFVFFPPSPRFVTPAQAASLSARQAGGPRRVGLFVDPTDAEIGAVLAATSLDALQIYDTAERCRDLKMIFARPVWRAVGVADARDLPEDDEGLDGFVIEAKPPPAATRPGGNARALDLSLLADWRGPEFWLLGGGLTPGNVAGAIALTGAPGVDVSSGVEIAPGMKSPALIDRFVANSRSAARPAR